LYNTTAAFLDAYNAVQCSRNKVRFEKDAGPEPSASISRSDIEVCAARDREVAGKFSFSSSANAVITVTLFGWIH
jgi:hypothetical protein